MAKTRMTGRSFGTKNLHSDIRVMCQKHILHLHNVGTAFLYLPITAEQIRDYAVFDEENQTYYWVRLGCFNYAPTFFGTSLPEVVDIKENEDGTVTLTVEAVCDMVICDDAVITHELTVRFAEDGSFQYLGNEILNDEIMQIPDYQYRIKE